ncbi:MAG: ABC transporter substrate-binding protein [Chloroflexota bacterium]
MRLRRLGALFAALMLATLTFGSASAQDSGSVLRVARLADWFNLFHPVEFQTGNQFQWWNTIFNTLVKVDADSKTVVPDLADSWEVSEDGTQYTFHLHPGVKWHDGEPFTANDVAFTIDWYANNSTVDETGALAPVYKGFLPKWTAITGVKDVAGTLGSDGTITPGTGHVAGVEVIDDNTIKLTLDAPNSTFLAGLSDMANVIVPQHILKDATAADIETVPFSVGTPGVTVGTGPYKLVSFTPDQELDVEANPDYFKGAPKIDRIVFKLFSDPSLAIAQIESGDLDLAFRVPPAEFDRLAADPNLNVISAPNPGIVRIIMNTDTAPWDKVEVRQAIAYAINKQAIVDQFYKGRAQVLYNHPGFTVYDDINKYEYDPAKAAELLKAGGYNGEPFTIVYDQGFPDANAIMPLIQADLSAAGINAQLAPVDGSAAYIDFMKDRSKWGGAITVGGSEALSPDRSEQYYATTATPDSANSNYTNPEIFKLWDGARAEPDEAKRDEMYHQLALILNTDLPMIHLYAPNLVMVSTKDLGGGFAVHLNERESFMNVETWTLGSGS